MPLSGATNPRSAARPGAFTYLSEYLGGLTGYLRARLKLAGMEFGEAAGHYLLLLVFGVSALVAVLFGYLFLCLAIVFALGELFGGGLAWIWVTFGLAVLHLGGAVALVLIIRARLVRPVFTATLEEFKKDQQWLTTEKLS